jgi:putative ABC transport system ATP-binding protein
MRAPNTSDALPTPALSIRDLRFGYPGRPFVLSVARLEVAPGEQILLTGLSGSGKSTLLHLVAGLLEPDAGRIEVAGTHVHGLRGAERDAFRGRSIGMVFQTFHLLVGFTAAENIAIALLFAGRTGAEDRDRPRELLAMLGIDEPDAPVEGLSIGQQQRVAVARALAARPALVLADEPTASLDPRAAAVAVDLLRDTCRAEGAALLVVSHDPALEGRFDRAIRFDHLRSTGTPAGAAA